MIPIKCQVCPFFYDVGDGYECKRVTCELIDNEKLRKQVYEAIKNLGENK